MRRRGTDLAAALGKAAPPRRDGRSRPAAIEFQKILAPDSADALPDTGMLRAVAGDLADPAALLDCTATARSEKSGSVGISAMWRCRRGAAVKPTQTIGGRPLGNLGTLDREMGRAEEATRQPLPCGLAGSDVRFQSGRWFSNGRTPRST